MLRCVAIAAAATGCCLLQRAVVSCNAKPVSATGRAALQPVVMRCNEFGCAAAGCTPLQQELHSASTGGTDAQRCSKWSVDPLRWATAELYSVATRTTLLHRTALCCNKCCVAVQSAVATTDAPLQQMGNSVGCVVARTCGALLKHTMRRCNGVATMSVASSHKPAERCCKSWCAVATDGQQCRLRRRTNLRSAVATSNAPLRPTSAAGGVLEGYSRGTLRALHIKVHGGRLEVRASARAEPLQRRV